MGLIFGFGGLIVTVLLGTVYEEITGNYIRDLSTSIVYSLYGGFVGMQIGIGYDGYKYLKDKGRLSDFKRFFGQSILGLFLGLFIFYYYINPLTFVLPMIGAIIGFDFGIIKMLNATEKKNG